MFQKRLVEGWGPIVVVFSAPTFYCLLAFFLVAQCAYKHSRLMDDRTKASTHKLAWPWPSIQYTAYQTKNNNPIHNQQICRMRLGHKSWNPGIRVHTPCPSGMHVFTTYKWVPSLSIFKILFRLQWIYMN